MTEEIRCITSEYMKSPKTSPTPVRFEQDEYESALQLAKRVGLPFAEIVRRAVKYSVPRFESGEVNIADLRDRESKKTEAKKTEAKSR